MCNTNSAVCIHVNSGVSSKHLSFSGEITCMFTAKICSDAVQMIFSMHCCLHLVGQPVSVGRLDQLLIGYYQRDIEKRRITPERVCPLTIK